jgi:hypothetical protein
VVAIASGLYHALALKTNGSVVAWGGNGYGQATVPTAARSGVVAIAAGGVESVALKSDGSVVTWGANNAGQRIVPSGLPPVVALLATGHSTYAFVRDPAPSLTILRNADQKLSLSWRGLGALEQTESLTAPNWQPAPSQANPQTLTTTDATKFFRVKAD